MQEPLYTVRQVAAQLQVDPESVRRWLRAGELRGIKLGQSYRVTASELARFLAARKH